jgi:hypothetical protein
MHSESNDSLAPQHMSLASITMFIGEESPEKSNKCWDLEMTIICLIIFLNKHNHFLSSIP